MVDDKDGNGVGQCERLLLPRLDNSRETVRGRL